jgi:catechol 2,3-dioxygenase-like lactoylglutathione lyase family enzyme
MPKARLGVVTLGVTDFQRSVQFYERLGFERKMRATGDAIAFFETGTCVIALFRWDMLAEDAQVGVDPRPTAFRGSTLAWMCSSPDEVDDAMAHALDAGAHLLKPAQRTDFGGYSGYFADPDGHVWEAVMAPGFVIHDDGRVSLPA